MGSAKETFQDLGRAFVEGVRAAKESYRAGTRFFKMRVWIVAVVALDLFASFGFVIFSGGQPLHIVVWYQPGFPSNMLVVKNEGGRALKDVTLLLDNRYIFKAEQLDNGVNGFEVNHVFHDSNDLTPSDTYRPHEVEIRVRGNKVLLPISEQAASP